MEDSKTDREVVAAEYADSERPPAKTSNGITLVPQPSDDPQDPLVRLWALAREPAAKI
jgi:hypothetical protein